MILVSAGAFYGGSDAFNEPKSHFVAQMMGVLGYDAVAVGESDLNYGLEKLQTDVDAYRLPLTCANLLPKGTEVKPGRLPKTIFPAFRVVERNGKRFAFVGLLSPYTKAKRLGEDGQLRARTYVLVEPKQVLAAAVSAARKDADVVVLLAHMSRPELDELVAGVDGVDMIIQGFNPKATPEVIAAETSDIPLYMATSQGQTIGHLVVEVGESGLFDFRYRAHYLDNQIPDDPDMVHRLEQFDAENRAEQKRLFAEQQVAGTGEEGPSEYVGVGTCQQCHAEAFDVYVQTGHARAYQTLAAQFVHRDENCVSCHVTGYKEAGGFDGVRRRGSTLDLVDVQCESCHGPGANHARDGSYRVTAIQSCVKCHTPEQDPDFNFVEDWKKIAH